MQLPNKPKYTYADYANWSDGKRYELIDGEVYMMSPAPSVNHQEISVNLVFQFATFLKGKTCKVFSAPFDVRLNADAEDDTVVQPDISIVCDPDKIKNGKNCKGAPDMIIEILSPSSARRDQFYKFNQYLAAGVKEYWIVYPETKTVQAYTLTEGQYVGRAYCDADMITVSVLEDCQINLADVFPAETAPQEEG